MKLAFSTLGCPYWTWDEIFATAKDMRIDGIEVRGIGRTMYAPAHPLFGPEQSAETKARLASGGLVIPIFTSGAVLGLPDSPTLAVKEVRDYIELAARMEVPYIRVLSSPSAQPEKANLAQARELYGMLCAEAKSHGVTLLIETSGALADSSEMERFMEGTDPACAGVLWDLHHPYRFCGETPEVTYSRIGQHLRYMHVKDSVMKNGEVQYRMMGHGDVPIFDALKLLSDSGYDGFVSLEWVKRWNKELQEPGLVFYHYNTYMQYLIEQL